MVPKVVGSSPIFHPEQKNNAFLGRYFFVYTISIIKRLPINRQPLSFIFVNYLLPFLSKFTAQESISDTRRVFTIPLPCIGIDTRLIIISPIST